MPRPEILPVKMRGKPAQPRTERAADSPWSGAPRPELLPGMGPTRPGGPRRAAQARSSQGVSTTPIPAGQLRVIGEGRPLEPGILQTMERFFEADFSGVRVHEGPAAQSMGALAFTLGEELHFAPGLYDPTTREGVELLGHELTHVVQQRDGRVANPYGQGIAIVQDPALEAEADRMGREVAAELWSGPRAGQPAMAIGRPAPRKIAAARRTLAVQAKPAARVGGARPLTARRAAVPRAVQRANAIEYVQDRNEGDIAEGQKYFKALKSGLTLLQETGPSGLALRTVDLAKLPEGVRNQIADVQAAPPTDPWDLYGLGFRDFHSNRGGHLPENDPGPGHKNAKQQEYYDAASDAQFDRDQRGYVAQYAEFHLTGSGLGKAYRLLYDYMQDMFYVTITHYNIWPIYDGGGDTNPFFRVV